MKIALVGYGKMGKSIEKIATERGHNISLIIGSKNKDQLNPDSLVDIDVAIEFSTPDSAYGNLQILAQSGTNTISGTTGWLAHRDEIEQLFVDRGAAFLYASNFSVGVNLFFEFNKILAKIISPHKSYRASIDEVHHIHKKDAPSGTAISLADDIIDQNESYKTWVNGPPSSTNDLPIISHREGEVYGTHIINYLSDIDMIQIKHEARSRMGFALGAVVAAEYISNKKGLFSMKDVLALS